MLISADVSAILNHGGTEASFVLSIDRFIRGE
jgi:hypothetical protein